MELELKRCQKISGASKRASQQNGGGGKKLVTKKRWWCHSLFHLRPPPVCCHLFFATPTLFSPPLFCHPHPFFASPPSPPPTIFLSPLFCHQFLPFFVFGNNNSSNKIFSRVGGGEFEREVGVAEVGVAGVGVAKVGVAKKWWQK